MAEVPSAIERPFQVWIKDGVIHSGHPTEEAAEKACDRANAKAAEFGITTRYEVWGKDGDDG